MERYDMGYKKKGIYAKKQIKSAGRLMVLQKKSTFISTLIYVQKKRYNKS